MARPTKWRKIEGTPAIPFFTPSEEGRLDIEQNVLLMEEFEAIRLKDYEGLEQEECAKRMEVSRPTFQRILSSAHEKLADCLIHGKTIHIDGGTYTRNICNVVCADCKKEWKESYEKLFDAKKGAYVCPTCGSAHVSCGKHCEGRMCKQNCCKKK